MKREELLELFVSIVACARMGNRLTDKENQAIKEIKEILAYPVIFQRTK